jgi:hypothetical protein
MWHNKRSTESPPLCFMSSLLCRVPACVTGDYSVFVASCPGLDRQREWQVLGRLRHVVYTRLMHSAGDESAKRWSGIISSKTFARTTKIFSNNELPINSPLSSLPKRLIYQKCNVFQQQTFFKTGRKYWITTRVWIMREALTECCRERLRLMNNNS